MAGLTVGILAVTAGARASTITQSFNIPSQATAFSHSIDYSLFNSGLGTLTGVTLDLSTTSVVEIDVYNINLSPQAFTNAKATFPLTVTGPPGSTTYITDTITAGPISGTANPATLSVGPPPGLVPTETVFPGVPGNENSGVVPVPSADWVGNWEKPGGGLSVTDLVFSSGIGNYSGSANSGVFFGGSGSVSGTLTLVYTYTAGTTPEPGAWALLVASASVSLAGLRRRRMAK
jgi:hypothetical protein